MKKIKRIGLTTLAIIFFPITIITLTLSFKAFFDEILEFDDCDM